MDGVQQIAGQPAAGEHIAAALVRCNPAWASQPGENAVERIQGRSARRVGPGLDPGGRGGPGLDPGGVERIIPRRRTECLPGTHLNTLSGHGQSECHAGYHQCPTAGCCPGRA
ncbi:MAG: hypothetical protein OXG34_11750 [bacterium]|nr:hypothetical protein [bacterium]